MAEERDLVSGWTQRSSVYHFDHVDRHEAERLVEEADGIHVVKTINGTCANDDCTEIHENIYFAYTLADAIGLAAQLQLGFYANEVAEQVVAVRPATPVEIECFWVAHDRLDKGETPAIPDFD